MELTGVSSDFICDSSTFSAAMRDFISRQWARWPSLLLDDEDLPESPPTDWTFPGDSDEKMPGILTFCRDEQMDTFWDNNGYAIEPTSGEGPFAVFFSLATHPFYARNLVDVHEIRPLNKPSAEFQGTQLLLAQYIKATLLTPDDPSDDPFSQSVLRDFLTSLGGQQLAARLMG
ncbi:hypothetical protein [Streptomyces profundus]|uniref:hypothetical protein n=1 Tax=Streptomyces profundus TaxID=2867410 RepID=UPI001D16C672|nr:hypothetical protein [Streptomyces sp. MA3_2.13]UED85057.1 hypothetical protein K4G22_13320 [Streptomyces sp. MA3_2.13]